MELIGAYFWLLKITTFGISLFIAYKAIVTHKLRSKFWNITTIIVFILTVISPIKMAQPMVGPTQTRHIEASKVLPPKVENNSFATKVTNVKHITTEELE